MTETPQPPAAQPAAPMSDSDARQLRQSWPTSGNDHLSRDSAPLIMWLIGRDRVRLRRHQGKEALNFGILCRDRSRPTSSTASSRPDVRHHRLPVDLRRNGNLGLLIFGIQGRHEANKGENYRYPFNPLRLIK